MSEATARQHLREMLGHFTPGSDLHLLADIFREDAEAAHDDPQAHERYRTVEAALFVVGMGVDAACPR